MKKKRIIKNKNQQRTWCIGNSTLSDKTKKIKNSKLIKLEGTGHELHVDDWELIIVA